MTLEAWRKCVLVTLWLVASSCTSVRAPSGQGAVGSLAGLKGPLRRAFQARGDFRALPRPGPRDWLARFRERGQTFSAFQRERPPRPDGRRRKLYLQPVGRFPRRGPSLRRLRECAGAHFGLEVVALPVVPGAERRFTSRRNPWTRHRQLLAPDILRWLRSRLPTDGFAVLGVTMVDLYPEPSWNFVFGQASLNRRVGVFSFARYDPASPGEKRQPSLLLRRSCKVLVHETGHMFGLRHCIYYECAMNGSNHLVEADARPLRLCPVCLRKLRASVGFDVVRYYQGLARFFRRAGLAKEARWTERRLGWIERGR